jgi:hypothetical protein
MAFGRTLQMRALSNLLKPAEPREHPTPGRDRSLRGKARTRARKAARRAARHG